MKSLHLGQYIQFSYEGEARQGRIEGFEFGQPNETYLYPVFFIKVWDYDKDAYRSFEVSKIDWSTAVFTPGGS